MTPILAALVITTTPYTPPATLPLEAHTQTTAFCAGARLVAKTPDAQILTLSYSKDETLSCPPVSAQPDVVIGSSALSICPSAYAPVAKHPAIHDQIWSIAP